MIQSFLLFVAAIFGLMLPVLAQHMRNSEHKADIQQKSERACLAEWRAGPPKNRPKGMTQQVFVQQCRSGAAAAQTSASAAAAPSTNGTATPLQKPSASPHPAKRRTAERHGGGHARHGTEKQASRTAPAD